MNSSLPTRRAGLRALVVVAALGTVVVAARPSAGRTVAPSVAAVAVAAPGVRHAPSQGGAVVQVRDFPSSSIIEVVAWNAAQPSYGLRTWVRRSGAPDRYHRLWVNIDYGPGGRDIAQAQGLNRPLPVTSATDTQNCVSGQCSPTSTFGARLPDGPFRASKEDVAVKFITGSGSEITITARRALIDAYLGTVDSLVAALKK